MKIAALTHAAHRLLRIGGRAVGFFRRGVGRQGQRHLDEVELHVVGAGGGEGPAIDDVEDVPARARPDRLRIAAWLYPFERRIERGVERARQDPTEIAARCGGRSLGKLLRDRAERSAATELLHDSVGAALALVDPVGPVDGHEDFGDARFGLADVGAHAAHRVVDLCLRDVDLRAHLAADDLAPRDLRLDLLLGDVGGDADALEVELELSLAQPGRPLDLGVAAVDLGVRGAHAELLGVLDLQALVDHLPQHLSRHALTQIGTVRQAGGADGEEHALRQVEVGDRVVVDARDDAQTLTRCRLDGGTLGGRPLLGRGRNGQRHDGEEEGGAEEWRGHFTNGA